MSPDTVDFVVVGSGGGGGTISWVLAKAGFSVAVLEQGPDFERPLDDVLLEEEPRNGPVGSYDTARFNPRAGHDEYRFRLERPDPKRRPRGEYNTFRTSELQPATPSKAGWTGSVLGGGSVLWGTWSFRALPIDFRLATHFGESGQLDGLTAEGYSITDWPIEYGDLEPYYNVAEALLAVSGSRADVIRGVTESPWFKHFGAGYLEGFGNWEPSFEFPNDPYPRTPVGEFFYQGAERAGFHPLALPSGINTSNEFSTAGALGTALESWGEARPEFWSRPADELWSRRVRDACNFCGFCGEFLCWGSRSPKSSTWATTLKELRDLNELAEVRTDAKCFEVLYDARTRRATGVRYLDTSDPNDPVVRVQKARHVIVSCGAVQSTRLLLMSGPPAGLGNRYGQVGRHATFHLFGLQVSCTLPSPFQGYLHSEFGHTGNTTTFSHYFVEDPTDHTWWKAGTMASTARKNPLENADGAILKGTLGLPLLQAMETYPRTLQIRLTGDDLPMPSNRVDLDPTYVDEYGLPVARITRNFGPAEIRLFGLVEAPMREVVKYYQDLGLLKDTDVTFSRAIVDLIGDHQMGTCRMGADPTRSVVDPFCRLHEVPNVFVVDSSFMPTGFGLNPMVTVVANALRVGTWIAEQSKSGEGLA